ncbi:methyl-accepting chemotaxis protein [Sporomusa sp. KB1]|jgi:methyl-accepting chemotaxis protein|uniref:methyl-accepting chemotaxis protein n=1 Tax=Sporomusa sp. KB1 TaxID=943346 RepID=UPI0011A3A516|nr:methyl-accepting chemotaxis protein [Sporomusa sp. KB1]TWH45872.1 methyl-accepting chemotaxis protein [Sporomusa sp. KB1]
MKIASMKIKLLIILAPFILLSFTVLSGISYYLSQQAISHSVDETALAVGNDYSKRVETYVEKAVLQLESFSTNKSIYNPVDKQQLVEALGECARTLSSLDNVTYISTDGSALRPDGTTVQLGDRKYFKQAITTRKPVVSEILLSRTTGKVSINVAVPVIHNGQLTGVLTGAISMERLTSLIKDLQFQDTGYGAVTDDLGTVIIHPRLPEVVGKLNFTEKKINPELKMKESELDDHLISLFKASIETGKQVRGIYKFADGITRIGVFTPIQLLGNQRWVIIVTAPEAEATQKSTSLAHAMLLGSLIFIILAILFIITMSKRIARPITLIRDECMLLASGDLREQLTNSVSSHDEIGQLAQGFQTMRSNLRVLVSSVLSRAEQLAASSEELTASAQQSAEAANQVAGSITEIAAGAEKQAISANQISAIAQEMAKKTETILIAAQEASVVALTASQEAEQGRQTVDRTVEQMNEIGRGSASLETAIEELSKGSQEISEIVTLISNIAKQTNLLALNAAIEAARAGEYGRGFAVVAEEVRKLAEESNQATQKIDLLIKQNQLNMSHAVTASQARAEGIRTGIDLVDATGETFKNIVESVLQISDQIKDISTAINQMVGGNKILVVSIREIDEVSKRAAAESQTVSAATEEQSASMEQIASSSQSLAILASDLQATVVKFQV